MIDDQLNKYKGAIGKRNVGSDPSPETISATKNTAMGNNKGTITSSSGTRLKGSWEGYMDAKSTYIQMNGTGYDAPSAQSARGARIPSDFSSSHNAKSIVTRSSLGSVNDYRLGRSANSSYNKLKNLTKLNRLF